MNSEVITAFRRATVDVFRTMLNLEINCGTPSACDQMLAKHDVSGMVGLSGGLSGDVIISFDQKLAILATATLLGDEPSELDGDVVDAVGELTNMIAGAAKGSLERHDMSLSLPTVILGTNHRVGFKTGVQPISIPFESKWGNFSIEIGLMKDTCVLATGASHTS